MVFMDMGADHDIYVRQLSGCEIIRQWNAPGGAIRKFTLIRAAAIDQHHKCAVPRAGIGAFQQHGLAVTHIYIR